MLLLRVVSHRGVVDSMQADTANAVLATVSTGREPGAGGRRQRHRRHLQQAAAVLPAGGLASWRSLGASQLAFSAPACNSPSLQHPQLATPPACNTRAHVAFLPAPCLQVCSPRQAAGPAREWRPRCWLDVLQPAATLVSETLERFQGHGSGAQLRPAAERWLQVVVAALAALGPAEVERADRARYQRLLQSLQMIGRWEAGAGCWLVAASPGPLVVLPRGAQLLTALRCCCPSSRAAWWSTASCWTRC